MENLKSPHSIRPSQIATLIVLAALLAVIGLLSFQVLSVFLLPLFLAGMLAVLFQPLQVWLTAKFKGRRRLAALTTTLVLLSGVLLPSIGIGLMAVTETASLARSLDRDALAARIKTLQNRWSLGPPPAEVMEALERSARYAEQLLRTPPGERGANDPLPEEQRRLVSQLQSDAALVESKLALQSTDPAQRVENKSGENKNGGETVPAEQLQAAWTAWTKSQAAAASAAPADWVAAWDAAVRDLTKFRSELLGGPIAAWFKQNINVDPDQLQSVVDRVRSGIGPAALGTTQFLASFFMQFSLGLVIVLVGTYYFLADGREMIESIIRLTPLDPTYIEQIVVDFANLTRAVVLSMLLAAAAQGVLAGIGYYFAGVHALFLLTMLTTLCAMLPLVGATFVWGGAALWLYLHDGRPTAAIGLAVYGTVVVGMADNLIKPMVLHGRSNLHPLAALLSVIGGVGALGPIGVFVGPMVVALLHTVLVMLRKELTSLEKKTAEQG